MLNYNKAILSGNLTRDPELTYTQAGTAICKIGLAVNRSYKKGDSWEKEVLFIDCVIFGKRGEAVSNHFQKGSSIFVEGHLKFESWSTQEGQKRSKISLVVDDWYFAGGAQKDAEGSTGQIPDKVKDDIPF